MLGFLKKLLDPNDKELKRLGGIVQTINNLEGEVKALSDGDLRARTGQFKERLSRGAAPHDILPEAFAVVREAAVRTLGQRHFDVQLMGGIVLHEGRIAEMKTGEGKTLAATCPVYLNALTGRGVHVVTVNDYLAKRDAEWMGAIYNFLGLEVGALVHGLDYAERKRITAATSSMAPTTSSVLTTCGQHGHQQRGHRPAGAVHAIIDGGLHPTDEARTLNHFRRCGKVDGPLPAVCQLVPG